MKGFYKTFFNLLDLPIILPVILLLRIILLISY